MLLILSPCVFVVVVVVVVVIFFISEVYVSRN